MLTPTVSQAVVGALALGAAAGAQATPPTPVTLGQVPAGNILYISGSTTIDSTLVDYMLNPYTEACDRNAATPVVYSGTETGAEFSAVSCIAAALVGLPANTKIAIIKEDNQGESIDGILTVSAPTSNFVEYPNNTAAGFDTHCPVPASPVTTEGVVPYFPVTCDETYPAVTSTATTGPYSALAFSDVEGAIFGLNATNVGQGNSVDTPFGVAVSLGLYHALQGAEGKTEDDMLADMPNLNRAQLAAIFNGYLTDWTHVYGAGTGSVGAESVHFGNSGLSGANHICYDGTPNSTAADCQAGTQASVAHTPADTTIYLCERGQDYGIQQAAQSFFAGEGCIAKPVKFQSPLQFSCLAGGCAWSSSYFGDTVFAGFRQRDDMACLGQHDELGDFAISYATTDQAWGRIAVAENLQYLADWRFIRVDGYAPSIENIAAGKYYFWMQSAVYYATSGANRPGGNALALLNFFTNPNTRIGSTTAAAVDRALQRSNPTLDGGILTIPEGADPNPHDATLAQFRLNPVNGLLRNYPANSCQPPYLALPVGVAQDTSDTPTWDPASIQ